MKKRHKGFLGLFFCLAFYSSMSKAELQCAEELSDVLYIPQDCEEPDESIKVIPRTPKISIKDVPVATKLFCSYLYESKLQPWYRLAVGYLKKKSS